MIVRGIIVINVNIVENKRVLLRHILNLFRMETGIIVISVNIKRQRSVYVVKTHIESVHNGNWYHCDQCEYKAAYKSAVETHIESVHPIR